MGLFIAVFWTLPYPFVQRPQKSMLLADRSRGLNDIATFRSRVAPYPGVFRIREPRDNEAMKAAHWVNVIVHGALDVGNLRKLPMPDVAALAHDGGEENFRGGLGAVVLDLRGGQEPLVGILLPGAQVHPALETLATVDQTTNFLGEFEQWQRDQIVIK